MSKRLFAPLALACAVAALPVANALSSSKPSAHAAASAPFTVGIADQHEFFMTDPRFTPLGITHARIYLPWDLFSDKAQVASADAYMQAAQKAGIDVLVTFSQSRRGGSHNSVNPTPAQMASALKAYRKKWPFLHEFATWNEVNLEKKNPAMVAKWWMALKKACPSCTLLGAELVDRAPANNQKSASQAAVKKDISTWTKAFLKATHGKQPTAWGLHNYDDANLGHTYGTKALLAAVKGQIWFTETGGLVSRHSSSKIKMPEGQAHATAATKYILTKLARVSSRIKRVYLYEWTDSTTTWDSAFTGPQNQTRSSLTYLTQFMNSRRRR
jgi:hypothetical protein